MTATAITQGPYGLVRTGGKYTGYRRAVEIAKDVRADIKAAQKSGLVPADIKVSVRSDYNSINVSLSGWTSEQVWEYGTDSYGYEGWHRTDAAQAVLATVEEIREAYNRDASDYHTDYFDVLYYGQASWAVRADESQRSPFSQ